MSWQILPDLRSFASLACRAKFAWSFFFLFYFLILDFLMVFFYWSFLFIDNFLIENKTIILNNDKKFFSLTGDIVQPG